MPLQTYEAVLAYNNGIAQFATNPIVEWVDSLKGVVIHKIDAPTAMAISTRIKPNAAQYRLPLTYALGCLAIESTLDPACQNGNLGLGESNTANDPLGYDMGIAQLKLRYLLGVAQGVADADTAKAFALDIDKAIPYFCSLMSEKVTWATQVIAQNTSSAPDVRMNNPLILATNAYNYGDTGVMPYYTGGQFPTHGQHVIDLEAYFAKQLAIESCFANLPT